MKKINFVSGNAKLALAAFAVASLTLTSCEKEDFDVNVPDITVIVPDVTIPEAEAGVAYVILSAASANGNTLTGVTYEVTNNGGEKITDDMYKFTTSGSLTVTASKDGYETVVKTITVPAPQKGSYQTFSLNFVLNAIAEAVVVTPGEDLTTPAEDTNVAVANTISDASLLEPGTHTTEMEVLTGVAYTEEQKAELLSEVDKLTGPTSRAANDEAEANLQIAKSNLKSMINSPSSTFNKAIQKVTYTLSGKASSLTITPIPSTKTIKVTIETEVANEKYAVEGAATEIVESVSKIETKAEGADVSHSHGHGNGNAGGGTGE